MYVILTACSTIPELWALYISHRTSSGDKSSMPGMHGFSLIGAKHDNNHCPPFSAISISFATNTLVFKIKINRIYYICYQKNLFINYLRQIFVIVIRISFSIISYYRTNNVNVLMSEKNNYAFISYQNLCDRIDNTVQIDNSLADSIYKQPSCIRFNVFNLIMKISSHCIW